MRERAGVSRCVSVRGISRCLSAWGSRDAGAFVEEAIPGVIQTRRVRRVILRKLLDSEASTKDICMYAGPTGETGSVLGRKSVNAVLVAEARMVLDERVIR